MLCVPHTHGMECAGHEEAENTAVSLERRWRPGGGPGMVLAQVSSPVRVHLQ